MSEVFNFHERRSLKLQFKIWYVQSSCMIHRWRSLCNKLISHADALSPKQRSILKISWIKTSKTLSYFSTFSYNGRVIAILLCWVHHTHDWYFAFHSVAYYYTVFGPKWRTNNLISAFDGVDHSIHALTVSIVTSHSHWSKTENKSSIFFPEPIFFSQMKLRNKLCAAYERQYLSITFIEMQRRSLCPQN